MVLVLTLLSKLAAWALLAVLGVGLYQILETLKSVRASLEKITMGVRAIEKETAPLAAHASAAGASLGEVAAAVDATARQLEAVDRDLGAAAPVLRSRL